MAIRNQVVHVYTRLLQRSPLVWYAYTLIGIMCVLVSWYIGVYMPHEQYMYAMQDAQRTCTLDMQRYIQLPKKKRLEKDINGLSARLPLTACEDHNGLFFPIIAHINTMDAVLASYMVHETKISSWRARTDVDITLTGSLAHIMAISDYLQKQTDVAIALKAYDMQAHEDTCRLTAYLRVTNAI